MTDMTTAPSSAAGLDDAPIVLRALADERRADPRMVAALAPFGMDQPAALPPLDHTAPIAEVVAFGEASEEGFEGLFAALYTGLERRDGITREVRTIPATDGHEITLHIHRPAGVDGALPGVLHIHGGGMVMLSTDGPAYARWRDEVAATGHVVVGVDFRNGLPGGGGHNPYPAGLDDCVDALAWVDANRADLGITHLVVQGESGGGNLTLATAQRALRAGGSLARAIAGVYAMCPYISNRWAERPDPFPSHTENDGYFLACGMMAVLGRAYDPDGSGMADPMCWPAAATPADLAGLPPHRISVNELDPLRDEGLEYYRTLLAAGVPATARTVQGTSHAGDMIFLGAMPDVYAATMADLAWFIGSVG